MFFRSIFYPRSDIGKFDKLKNELLEKYEESFIDLGDEAEMKKLGLTNYLNPQAKIFLISCLTGAEGKNGDNMTKMISRVFQGADVIAPKYATNLDRYEYDEQGSLINAVFVCGDKNTLKMKQRKLSDNSDDQRKHQIDKPVQCCGDRSL